MAQLTILNDHDDQFPPVSKALLKPNGLLAAGGQLSTQRLFSAYQQGIFPWYSEGEPIMWWSPNPRCVIKTDDFYVSSSFARFLRKKTFKVTINLAFEEVIKHCASPRPYEDETWINSDIIAAYTLLHKQGIAHSIEVWHDDELVGGVYGLFVANTFCGESMFSLMSNASKTGLYALSRWLNKRGISLIDCQVPNPHLLSLGAKEMPRTDFVAHLKNGLAMGDPKEVVWSVQEISYE